jgi:hypothetical protein
MYAEFLTTLGKIAEKLNEAAVIGGEELGPPTPYLAGKVEVRLDGERVGWFEFVDEWVNYVDDPGPIGTKSITEKQSDVT